MEIWFLMFDLAKNALPDTILPSYPGLGLALGAHWNAPPRPPPTPSDVLVWKKPENLCKHSETAGSTWRPTSCGYKHRTFLLWGKPLHYCITTPQEMVKYIDYCDFMLFSHRVCHVGQSFSLFQTGKWIMDLVEYYSFPHVPFLR